MLDTDSLFTVAVLVAAFTHATWHALLKFHGNMLQTIAAVYGACSLVCLAALPLVPMPDASAMGFVIASVVLHCASYVVIAHTYERSDLSFAFPLFRGTAPLLVALGAWATLGERPGSLGILGLLLAAGGVASLALERGLRWRANGGNGIWLMLSALFVAAYTVVDGHGVRASGTPLGYVVWLFLLNGPAIMGIAWLVRRHRSTAYDPVPTPRLALAAVLALLSHGLVIWALSAGAVATVAALRETSVIFAAIIGTLVLGEPFGRYRILASVCVTAGVIVLHAAGVGGR